MSGIYIHIPFCKQACHYCDFHFSTSMAKKNAMVSALKKELELRKKEFTDEVIETIYFGGGTPSILSAEEIDQLIGTVYDNYNVSENVEITLEANPDDLSRNRLIQLSNSVINRLSIGIQSFFEEDLRLMNRAHTAREAMECLLEASKLFNNISVDLIYGIPGSSNDRWEKNIEKVLSFDIPHISSYALTVEPKTALAHMIKTGKIPDVDEEQAQQQFLLLIQILEKEGFVHYETSNFGKEGYFSRNNTAYWQGKKYVGIGPSAHSFDGLRRGWNIGNNTKYIKAIQEEKLPMESETLSAADRYNEYVMTGLRTIWGVSLEKLKSEFGEKYLNYLTEQGQRYIEQDLLTIDKDILKTTKKGRFLVDGIASDLFILN